MLTGNQADNGGAIYNAGSLALNRLIVSNNQASLGFGGGIYNTGTLGIVGST